MFAFGEAFLNGREIHTNAYTHKYIRTIKHHKTYVRVLARVEEMWYIAMDTIQHVPNDYQKHVIIIYKIVFLNTFFISKTVLHLITNHVEFVNKMVYI